MVGAPDGGHDVCRVLPGARLNCEAALRAGDEDPETVAAGMQIPWL